MSGIIYSVFYLHSTFKLSDLQPLQYLVLLVFEHDSLVCGVPFLMTEWAPLAWHVYSCVMNIMWLVLRLIGLALYYRDEVWYFYIKAYIVAVALSSHGSRVRVHNSCKSCYRLLVTESSIIWFMKFGQSFLCGINQCVIIELLSRLTFMRVLVGLPLDESSSYPSTSQSFTWQVLFYGKILMH